MSGQTDSLPDAVLPLAITGAEDLLALVMGGSADDQNMKPELLLQVTVVRGIQMNIVKMYKKYSRNKKAKLSHTLLWCRLCNSWLLGKTKKAAINIFPFTRNSVGSTKI